MPIRKGVTNRTKFVGPGHFIHWNTRQSLLLSHHLLPGDHRDVLPQILVPSSRSLAPLPGDRRQPALSAPRPVSTTAAMGASKTSSLDQAKESRSPPQRDGGGPHARQPASRRKFPLCKQPCASPRGSATSPQAGGQPSPQPACPAAWPPRAACGGSPSSWPAGGCVWVGSSAPRSRSAGSFQITIK